jgi:oligopeptide/dipeptide ABC transporter ATP-binding protein
MYAGRIVERARTADLFKAPRHHYTAGLLRSVQAYHDGRSEPETAAAAPERPRMREIRGMVPSLHELPRGCKFLDRCDAAQERCRVDEPELVQLGPSKVRCHFPVEARA